MEFRKMMVAFGNEEVNVYDKLSGRCFKTTAVKFAGSLLLLIVGGCIDRDSEQIFIDLNDLYDMLGLDRMITLNGYFIGVDINNTKQFLEMITFDDDDTVIFDPTPSLVTVI